MTRRRLCVHPLSWLLPNLLRQEASAQAGNYDRRSPMRSFLGVALVALTLGGSSTASTACSPCRVGGQDPVVFTDGLTNESLTVYQTGGVADEMLHFPQGRTYDLVHGLGTVPVSVNVFLSFRDRLTSSGNKKDKTQPNNVAESAGNQAVIEVW